MFEEMSRVLVSELPYVRFRIGDEVRLGDGRVGRVVFRSRDELYYWVSTPHVDAPHHPDELVRDVCVLDLEPAHAPLR